MGSREGRRTSARGRSVLPLKQGWKGLFKPFDIRHVVTGLECLAGFQSYLVFSQYTSFPLFGDDHVCSVALYS